MTIPHLMNCGHSDDGWCLECVKRLGEERDALRKAARAARDFIAANESFDADGRLDHECEFYTNPERGACRTCDMWADLNLAIDGEKEPE